MSERKSSMDPVHRSTAGPSRFPLTGLFIRLACLVLLAALAGCGAAATTDSSPVSGSATLSWTAPTTYDDGTPLGEPAGYKVYYGTEPGVYTSVTVGDVTSYHLEGLTKGQTYYFTVTAYDANGNESDYSNQVSKLIS